MKNIINLVIYLTIISQAISENSGWNQHTDYKSQKLTISDLISISVDLELSKFYTIHKNSKVYYWDYNTGNLLDSLEIDNNPYNIKLSKDAKTLLSIKNYQYKFNKKVQIIELKTKKNISEFDFLIPGTIKYCDPDDFYLINDFGLHLFDYIYLESQLNVAYGFNYQEFITGGPPYTEYSYGSCGEAGIYDVIENKIMTKKQISISPTLDFIVNENKIFATKYYVSGSESQSASLHSKHITRKYSIVLLDSNKEKTIISREYNYYYYWEWGRDESESSNGYLTPFKNIYYDNLSNKTNDRLIVNYGKKFFFINYDNEVVTDSIVINNSKANILLSTNFDYFIYFNNDSIYFQNSISKQIDSIIACPIIPDALVSGVSKGSLIAANFNGQIILFENITTNIAKENIIETNFSIHPNPATDFITIQLSNIELKPYVTNDKVQIFDMLGIEVMSETIHTMTSSHRMNVEKLPVGVYFIRIGDRVEKFVKI